MAAPLPTQAQAAALLSKLYNELIRRRAEAQRLQRYFLGDHKVAAMASKEFQEFTAERYGKFADNWCAPVAAAPAERMGVIGFKLPDSDAAITAQEALLWNEWKRNEMDSHSSQAFQAAIVQKRAFISVWGETEGPDKGAPIISTESAEQAIVAYDAETHSKRRAGLKVWTDDDGEHATLSTPAWVIPYTRLQLGAQNQTVSGLTVVSRDAGAWGVKRNDGQPIVNHLKKVPLVELPNRPVLGGEPVSDIDGVASLQDAANLMWLYLFNAADYASLPGRVVLGQEPPKIPILDETGKRVGERPVDIEALRRGRMLWLTGKDTKIDQWDAADLAVFTAVIEQIVGHIAAQTRTPPHYLVANKGISNLSGDALKAAETGLVMKVLQGQEHDNPRLRDVFELVALQLGQSELAKACRLGSARWKDAENRSDAQQSDAMVKDSQAGYPFEWLLMRRGHSPDEIKQIMDMRAREAQAGIAATVQGALRLPPPATPQQEAMPVLAGV